MAVVQSITDPTIFDNLRVVVEGALYERDLAGEILVVERRDLVDLAAFSRSFRMKVREKAPAASSQEAVQLEFRLTSQFMDFAAEKAAAIWGGSPPSTAGCMLEASLRVPLSPAERSGKVAELRPEHLPLGALRETGQAVEHIAAGIWKEGRERPDLQLYFHGTVSSVAAIELEARFRYARPLDEDDAAWIPDMLEDCLAVLQQWNARGMDA
ncbi:hypothetical protein [Xylanibacillus composti]|nr:hypothetical protein [Xylanibacillus composti]